MRGHCDTSHRREQKGRSLHRVTPLQDECGWGEFFVLILADHSNRVGD